MPFITLHAFSLNINDLQTRLASSVHKLSQEVSNILLFEMNENENETVLNHKICITERKKNKDAAIKCNSSSFTSVLPIVF